MGHVQNHIDIPENPTDSWVALPWIANYHNSDCWVTFVKSDFLFKVSCDICFTRMYMYTFIACFLWLYNYVCGKSTTCRHIFLEIRRFSTSGGPPFLREHQVVCDNRRWGWRWPWCSGAVRLGGSVQRWQPPNYGTPWCSSSELPSWFTSLGQILAVLWTYHDISVYNQLPYYKANKLN